MTLRTGSPRRILGDFEKVRVELRPASGEDGWLSLARRALRGGCHTCWGGGRWKSQNRKIVPLSPYVEEPLNSKVIKGFVPEQRSRQVFFVFRDSYVLCSIFMDTRSTFHTWPYLAMVQLHNSSVWLDTRNASRWNRNPVYFTTSRISYRWAISNLSLDEGI